MFTKILLIILISGTVIGAGIFGVIYYMHREKVQTETTKEKTNQYPSNINTVDNNSSNSANSTNTSLGQNSNTNNNSNSGGGGSVSNANSTNSAAKNCKDVEISGTWNLVLDVEGAEFSPAIAARDTAVMEFAENGKVDFTETYSDGGTTASAHHYGKWEKQDCAFAYMGEAEGEGVDPEYGPFTLHFQISAAGDIDPEGDIIIGDEWISNETYTSSEGVSTAHLTGKWSALKK